MLVDSSLLISNERCGPTCLDNDSARKNGDGGGFFCKMECENDPENVGFLLAKLQYRLIHLRTLLNLYQVSRIWNLN